MGASNRTGWRLLAAVPVMVVYANAAHGGPTILEGDWEVSSATYQSPGGVYRFRGNQLTIVFTSGDKAGRTRRTTITDYEFKFDDSTQPPRLVIHDLKPTGEKVLQSVETVEFKDGQMWLTRHKGWVTGMRRLPMPPVAQPPARQQATAPQFAPQEVAPQQAPPRQRTAPQFPAAPARR